MTIRAEIGDVAWSKISPLLPSTDGRRGGRYREHRVVVEGIVWKYRTGAPWRDLPERFGPWQTAWKRHDTWSADGTWHRVWQALQAMADAAGDLDWMVSAESSIARGTNDVIFEAASISRPSRGANLCPVTDSAWCGTQASG
jgi:transposase